MVQPRSWFAFLIRTSEGSGGLAAAAFRKAPAMGRIAQNALRFIVEAPVSVEAFCPIAIVEWIRARVQVVKLTKL